MCGGAAFVGVSLIRRDIVAHFSIRIGQQHRPKSRIVARQQSTPEFTVRLSLTKTRRVYRPSKDGYSQHLEGKGTKESGRAIGDSAAGETTIVCADLICTTSPNESSTSDPPGAPALDGSGESRSRQDPSPGSPALSDTSTADGSDDIHSSPGLPSLPAPRLPPRAQELLRSPPEPTDDDGHFGTASWGSPYPRTDRNLRRQSFSSEASEDSPIHHLAIDTPFLRPAPPDSLDETDSQPISAAAEVLANRARRPTRGLTEDWIRTHTTGDLENVEPRHWFSDGSGSEHSSLSGSENRWLDEGDPRTPKADPVIKAGQRNQIRHPRGRSSVDTLKTGDSLTPRHSNRLVNMAAPEVEQAVPDVVKGQSWDEAVGEELARPSTPAKVIPNANGEAKVPSTPTNGNKKVTLKEPAMTPRLKKKVPWKGKNIMILLPRDEERGLPGKAPKPLAQTDIQKMFDSWQELGYSVDGFDLLVEGQVPGTDDSQSREGWPLSDDVTEERSQRTYKVTLPDLNAWGDYVNELQEAKLRALGVSFAEEEPPAPPSPPTSGPSRQPSAQYPALPFSPPIPTSSASSNHAAMGFPFPGHFNAPAAQSPGIPAGASPVPFGQSKFNARQSISFPATASPFQLPGQSPQGWPHMQGFNGTDSPSFANLNGMMSPQSPFGLDGIQPTGSPAFMHGRQQSLQYPILPHQHYQQHQAMRDSPRLQEVREDEEELSKSPSKTPEPFKQEEDNLQAEIEDAEYHLEEQLRNQLEHEDYHPLQESTADSAQAVHSRQVSETMPVHEHFANEPGKPLTLHHPRPHSRGHSLTQNLYREQESFGDGNPSAFSALNDIPEVHKGDESYEIETNPSNLGTPVHNFEFPAPFGQHQKTASTVSNPWNDAVSVSSQRRPSHESKPSFSKLNVKAPEFKFNPASTSTFTPGQFSFGGQSFQPTVFQASVVEPVPSVEQPSNPIPSFQGSAETDNNPSFASGQSEFSFSSSGPKFRPDAPSFTPFQSVTTVTSPPPSASKHQPRESIFGNIQINTDIVKPNTKSKAIPIIRPASKSGDTPKIDEEPEEDEYGRSLDPTRTKRARSAQPDGEEVPMFAEQPADVTPVVEDKVEPAQEDEPTKDLSEAENVLPADTSISSAITSDQVETKATTAAPSEVSPLSATDGFVPFVFGANGHGPNKSELVSDEEISEVTKHKHHKHSLSATAPSFTPRGGSLFGVKESPIQTPTLPDEFEDKPTEQAVAESPASTQVAPTRSTSPKPKPRVVSKGLGSSRFASPPPKPKGLAASRYASEASPVQEPEPQPEPAAEIQEPEIIESVEKEHEAEPLVEHEEPHVGEVATENVDTMEPSFEDIDAIMEQLGNDPSLGVNRAIEHEQPRQTSPTKPTPLADVSQSPTYKLEPPSDPFIREASASTARGPNAIPDSAATPVLSTELEDPFVDQPQHEAEEGESPHVSNWEEAFSADEHEKLESRAQFFDGRVNELVGNLLASRLEPLEQALFSIHDALALKAGRPVSSRRDMRSVSGDRVQSDADDEDEEPVLRRSMSPRRDRRLEQMRVAVMDGLAAHYKSQPESLPATEKSADQEQGLLKAIAEMQERMLANMKPEFGGEEMKAIVENAVQSRLPPTPEPDMENERQLAELQAKVADLEHRLQKERDVADKEITSRRAAEDNAADLNRQLQAAETRVEVEIINRSVFDQRVADLEEKLRHQEAQTEEQVQSRRTAEDRLSEVQRLLRISSEEENRLRELNDENNQRIKSMEQANGKSSMKMALLEASQTNSTQSQSELTNKLNVLEADLRNVRQDNNHWRAEAERADETARRNAGELAHVHEENKHLHKSLNTLATQLEENERLRENWRSKFMSLQEDMGKAAREIAEDNARRIKKDQAMMARQEVLDARLQAEAKTRERLEIEMERLQTNERTGMRASNECQRLEGLLGEMRTENHTLSQRILEVQRDFEEARESAASEVQRARISMQNDLDTANRQVNLVREELEEQNAKLRAELDSFKLDADTVKARNEMLLEDAETTKMTEIEDLKQKHQNELEDIETRHEQQRSTAAEESSKTEQNLLERLSFSSTKIDHLQDRVHHLEEKLEVSKEAAAAAIAAAKSAGAETAATSASSHRRTSSYKTDVPEKISPQALRESIMVLQEQLQAREQRIEELEQTVAKSDPDAPNKISKRDDEITWLRELLAVRHGDLQDIITALSGDAYDRERVKDAAIRLKANLQMEQQERERAMNGGSAIKLPAIAQNFASSPRVAQTIGPIAAAWGNWRKNSQGSFGSTPGRMNGTPGGRNATPSRPGPSPSSSLGGLLTPPASNIRQSPLVEDKPQPTAFGSTGRRYTSQGSASSSGRVRGASGTSRQAEKMPAREPSPVRHELEGPRTPPMMRPTGYDSDAQPGDFDDDDFFEDN